MKDNSRLGGFQLGPIPPAPRGVPQIDVAFNIDSNGILFVTATDLGTKKKERCVYCCCCFCCYYHHHYHTHSLSLSPSLTLSLLLSLSLARARALSLSRALSLRSITISNSKGRLSEQEIEKMIRDAKKFAETDRKAKQVCE